MTGRSMRVSIWLVIMFLAGCAQPGTTYLVKDGVSRQQVESDQAECDQASTVGGYARKSDEEFVYCMKTRGYRETTSKEFNEPNSIPTWSGLARPLSR
jgi:hypothetical protein